MAGFFGKRDPGPCPVDDTPHTACTPESVALQLRRSPQTCTVVVHPPRVLTTGTYRRQRVIPTAAPLPAVMGEAALVTAQQEATPTVQAGKRRVAPAPPPVPLKPPPPPRDDDDDDDEAQDDDSPRRPPPPPRRKTNGR